MTLYYYTHGTAGTWSVLLAYVILYYKYSYEALYRAYMQLGMSEGMSRIVASLVRMLERPLTTITLCSSASEELLGMWLSFSLCTIIHISNGSFIYVSFYTPCIMHT